MIRSIRLRLTLWYVGILTLTLCLFGVVLFKNVSSNLYREIDLILHTEAGGVGEAVFSFWKAEREAQLGTSGPLPYTILESERKFNAEIADGKLAAIVARWAEATDELQTPRALRVVAPDGQTLAFSSSMAKWGLPFDSQSSEKFSKKTKYQTFRVEGQRVRLATRPILAQGHLLYYVQAATPLRQADNSIERLRVWLFWLIPATGLLTSLVGWFLASLALKPVDKMTTQAQKISELRLHERIDVPKTGDEIERLGLTFNEMLSRFERGFKRLRQFSAAASHELRTPLTIIKGELEWVLRKPRVEEEYQRVLRTQLDVVNEMASIVEQLLAVAHADEGEWAIEWRPVDFSVLVQSVRTTYQPLAQKKNINIEIQGALPVRVRGEEGLLQRLVSNLIENALKHTPDGGKVKIGLTSSETEMTMVVEDTGKGIEENELPKIFEKFFSRRINPQGIQSTGIGLGLCRWIAEVHQGKIEASSPSGRGAVFAVTLPLFKGLS